MQNLVRMGLLSLAKIEGTRNPASDVLQRLKTQLGVVSNRFNYLVTAAHDTDVHVAPVLNAQMPPAPRPPPYWEWAACCVA